MPPDATSIAPKRYSLRNSARRSSASAPRPKPACDIGRDELVSVESILLEPGVVRARVQTHRVEPEHVRTMASQLLGYTGARVWLVDMSAADKYAAEAIPVAIDAIRPAMDAGLHTIVLVTHSPLIRLAASTVRMRLHFGLRSTSDYDDAVRLARAAAREAS